MISFAVSASTPLSNASKAVFKRETLQLPTKLCCGTGPEPPSAARMRAWHVSLKWSCSTSFRQAKTELVSGAADFQTQFMVDHAAKQERQAMECAQLETRRKAELERIAQARPPRQSKNNGVPDYSPGR